MYTIDYIDGIKFIHCKNEGLTNLFGIMTLNGALRENEKNQGISHFCEHMFFKGTHNRSYEKLAKDIELIGSEQNAYTSNEEVFYHLSSAQEFHKEIIYNLMDMFFNSSFPEEEVEKEKSVILEEKKRSRDEHFSRIYDDMGKKFFNFEYGHPILGENETISSFTRDDLINYLSDTINKSNICFVYVGGIDFDTIRNCILQNLPKEHSYLKDGSFSQLSIPSLIRPEVTDRLLEIEMSDLTQNYVFDLSTAYDIDHPNINALQIFSNCFGGSGFFNKMFMEIREKNGLAYACGCWPVREYTRNLSSFMRYAMISEDKLDEYSQCLEDVTKDILKNGFDKEMIDCAKAKELFSIAKSSTNNFSLARYALKSFYGDLFTPSEKSILIKNVSYDQVNDVAQDILSRETIRVIMKPSTEDVDGEEN